MLSRIYYEANSQKNHKEFKTLAERCNIPDLDIEERPMITASPISCNPSVLLKQAYYMSSLEDMEAYTVLSKRCEALNAKNEIDPTSLFDAVILGNIENIGRFLGDGVSINMKDDLNEKTPFHWSSITGDIKIADNLWDYKPNIEARDKKGYTPLHKACLHDRIEMIKWLLNHGANIEAKDNIGFNCLHLASHKNKITVVQTLLETGADPYTKTGSSLIGRAFVGSTSLELTTDSEIKNLLKSYMK